MDALVNSSVKKHLGRRIGIALILVLLIVVSLHLPIVQSVHATDAECAASNIEELRTECTEYLDDNGAIIPDSEYLKCNDFIRCDPRPGTDIEYKRCCIRPDVGIYGGKCLDISNLDRRSLGGVGSFDFIPLRLSQCNYDEDTPAPSGKTVFLVPPSETDRNPDPNIEDIVKREKTLVEYYDEHKNDPNFMPDRGVSIGGGPIYEEPISMTIKPWLQGFRSIGVTWYYQVDPDLNRRYFIRERRVVALPPDVSEPLEQHISGVSLRIYTADVPFTGVGDVLKKIGCKIMNAIKTPFVLSFSALTDSLTTPENLPDVTFLCSKGTPQFDDPTKITFGSDGKIEGYNQEECTCVDSNVGPGVAAVLLCTRFVAGIEDNNAPWRLLVPIPDGNGLGTNRYMGLLLGEIPDTSGIDDFQNSVNNDTKEFFNSNAEVGAWIQQIVTKISRNMLLRTTAGILNSRFFGSPDPPADPDDVDINAFKQRPFVRQYISCLSCAKYGGFPTALGCMPADRVDRFLAEGVLGIGIGIAGAISVLCIIYGAIQFQLSAGEAAKVQKAQKLITQCILGLLLILFSVFLLRFVGVNLLRIYGLG